MQQDYLIAGLRVRMDTFGRAQEQAEPYLAVAAGEPDIVIQSDPRKIQEKQPFLSLEECEYLSTGSSFYWQLLQFGGLLLHASAVVLDGYAYLFSAPCGTGKSTHTRLWQETFGQAAILLNDDKPALRKEDGCWYAYGTPWSGKTAENKNMRAPVGGICVLSRGESNEIAPFGGKDAVFALLTQTARPASREARDTLLALLDDLMQTVPVWQLSCTPTVEAALVSQKAMAAEAYRRFGGG